MAQLPDMPLAEICDPLRNTTDPLQHEAARRLEAMQEKIERLEAIVTEARSRRLQLRGETLGGFLG